MRILVCLLCLWSGPAWSLDLDRLVSEIRAAGDLTPLFNALDVEALSADAGGDRDMPGALSALRDNLTSGGISRVAVAPGAAGLTLRIGFAGGGLNYLMLTETGDGALAGWYDLALGVHLHELLSALAGLDESRARALLKQLDEAPGKAMAALSGDTPLARLALAACAGRPCYADTLRRQAPLAPQRASLWRYERAVLLGNEAMAGQAMQDLRGDLGEDPGLAWLEAAKSLADGRFEQALERAEAGLAEAPTYRPLYPLAAQAAVSAGRYDRATHWFAALQARFGERVDWQRLGEQPAWRDYLRSESWRQWQAGD